MKQNTKRVLRTHNKHLCSYHQKWISTNILSYLLAMQLLNKYKITNKEFPYVFLPNLILFFFLKGTSIINGMWARFSFCSWMIYEIVLQIFIHRDIILHIRLALPLNVKSFLLLFHSIASFDYIMIYLSFLLPMGISVVSDSMLL